MNAEDREEVRQLLHKHEEDLKLIFVTRKDCEDNTSRIGKKLNEDYTRFKVMETKLNLLLIGVSVMCTTVIANFVERIIK